MKRLQVVGALIGLLAHCGATRRHCLSRLLPESLSLKPLIQGQAVVDDLQEQGGYESLQQAYRQVQYCFREDGNGRRGWNLAHGLRSEFDGRGLELTIRSPEAADSPLQSMSKSHMERDEHSCSPFVSVTLTGFSGMFHRIMYEYGIA